MTENGIMQVLEVWFTPDEFIGFLKGSAITHMALHREKGGAEDLQKAAWYAQRLAEFDAKREKGLPQPIHAPVDKLTDATMREIRDGLIRLSTKDG